MVFHCRGPDPSLEFLYDKSEWKIGFAQDFEMCKELILQRQVNIMLSDLCYKNSNLQTWHLSIIHDSCLLNDDVNISFFKKW